MDSHVEAGGKPMELLRATGDDGDVPGWKRGRRKGREGVAERKSLDTDISYVEGRTAFCMVDYVAALPVP